MLAVSSRDQVHPSCNLINCSCPTICPERFKIMWASSQWRMDGEIGSACITKQVWLPKKEIPNKSWKYAMCIHPEHWHIETPASRSLPGNITEQMMSWVLLSWTMNLSSDIVYSNCVLCTACICLPFLSHSWNSNHTWALYKHPIHQL